MGTFSKLMWGAALVAGVGAVAGAATIAGEFDPSVQFVGYPDSAKRGDKFTVTGVAIPSVGAASSTVYVTVSTAHRNGKAGVQESTSYIINVVGDAPAPFDIDVHTPGFGGTIDISATIVSEDIPGLAGGSASSISEISIAVTNGAGK